MVILKLLLINLLAFPFPHFSSDIKPGDIWLQLSESQRVIYLIGYVQGVDTGVDVSEDYDGIMYEELFNSNKKTRNIILKRVTDLYKNIENRSIPMLHMVFISYLESQGEQQSIIEMRLQMAKDIIEPFLGKNKVKQGDNWLQWSLNERQVYVDGLIKGIQTGIFFGKNNEYKLITLFDGIFNLGENIYLLADCVSEIVKDEIYNDINYQFLFPFAFMKFSKVDKKEIDEFYKKIRDKMEKKN